MHTHPKKKKQNRKPPHNSGARGRRWLPPLTLFPFMLRPLLLFRLASVFLRALIYRPTLCLRTSPRAQFPETRGHGRSLRAIRIDCAGAQSLSDQYDSDTGSGADLAGTGVERTCARGAEGWRTWCWWHIVFQASRLPIGVSCGGRLKASRLPLIRDRWPEVAAKFPSLQRGGSLGPTSGRGSKRAPQGDCRRKTKTTHNAAGDVPANASPWVSDVPESRPGSPGAVRLGLPPSEMEGGPSVALSSGVAPPGLPSHISPAWWVYRMPFAVTVVDPLPDRHPTRRRKLVRPRRAVDSLRTCEKEDQAKRKRKRCRRCSVLRTRSTDLLLPFVGWSIRRKLANRPRA